jgi:hypothetical protein
MTRILGAFTDLKDVSPPIPNIHGMRETHLDNAVGLNSEGIECSKAKCSASSWNRTRNDCDWLSCTLLTELTPRSEFLDRTVLTQS